MGATFGAAFTALLALSLLLPVFYHLGRIRDFNLAHRTPTLNGMDYIRIARPDEYAALAWLRDRANVPGQPVILEAATRGGFNEYGRVAANTGLLAPLGWGQHVGLYRNQIALDGAGGRVAVTYREIDQRVADVQTLYSAPDLESVRPLLERYQIKYIYVGYLERRDYKEAVDKFGALPVAQRFGNTVIYLCWED